MVFQIGKQRKDAGKKQVWIFNTFINTRHGHASAQPLLDKAAPAVLVWEDQSEQADRSRGSPAQPERAAPAVSRLCSPLFTTAFGAKANLRRGCPLQHRMPFLSASQVARRSVCGMWRANRVEPWDSLTPAFMAGVFSFWQAEAVHCGPGLPAHRPKQCLFCIMPCRRPAGVVWQGQPASTKAVIAHGNGGQYD